MLLSLTLLVLGVGLSLAQDIDAPKPCCFPAQWTGKAVSGAANSRRGSVGIFMPEIAVDFTKGRFAVHELVVPHGHHHGEQFDLDDEPAEGADRHPRVFNITTIGRASGNDSSVYVILWDHNKCITKHYRAKPGKKHCIPDKAKFGGSATIGGDSGVKVNRWVMSSRKSNDTVTQSGYDLADYIDEMMMTDDAPSRPRPKGFFAFSIVVSNKGCIPISEHIIKGDRRSHSVMGSMFFDIKGGIKDPSVFNPPSFCKKDGEYDVIEDMELTPLAEYFVEKFK